jgi:pyruvate dehydrogenase E2 component (dihydrolipoamide acetyltransferase)
MADIVIMPKLGQATEESTIVKWHKHEGDTVKKGDILFEMETDKAVLEAESFFEGALLKILVQEGETVPVNVAVAFIGTPGEKLPDVPPPPKAQKTGPATGGFPPQAGVGDRKSGTADLRSEGADRKPARPMPAAPAAPRRLLISPRARKLAESKVMDPAGIAGTGPDGRITEADVKAYLAARHYDALRISPAARARAAKEKIDILAVRGTGPAGRIVVGDVERAMKERPRPMSKMRQVIARRLTDSFTTTPHFYVTTSVDMTDLLAFRKERKDRGEGWGVTDFILEAVILSLQEFPPLNSVTDGHTIRWRANVDLGMAVGLDDGLVVPVIRAAQDLSMKELHDQIETLGKRAREGKLLPDEMTGSSFTVSNMGMFNVENFGAIINPGESGILAVSSTIPQAVARNGQIVARQMMKITASVDHRIVDGTTGALFVNAVKTKLEDMELWKRLT